MVSPRDLVWHVIQRPGKRCHQGTRFEMSSRVQVLDVNEEQSQTCHWGNLSLPMVMDLGLAYHQETQSGVSGQSECKWKCQDVSWRPTKTETGPHNQMEPSYHQQKQNHHILLIWGNTAAPFSLRGNIAAVLHSHQSPYCGEPPSGLPPVQTSFIQVHLSS